MTLAGKLALGCIAVVFACFTAWTEGVRVNTSPSMPRGLWREIPGADLHRGDRVTVCLTETWAVFAQERGYIGHGICPGGYELLVKQVAAMPHDSVTVRTDGIAVNGATVPNTTALLKDEAGRGLVSVQPGEYQVPTGFVWLLATTDVRSFDSRYWGPVPVSNVRSRVAPLLVVR